MLREGLALSKSVEIRAFWGKFPTSWTYRKSLDFLVR